MNLDGHVPEEMLEEYSRATLPAAEVELLEEHLLVCPQCQDRLAETDAFVVATRQAAARLRERAAGQQERPRWWWIWFPRPARLAATMGLAILLAGGADMWWAGRRRESPFPVYLRTERGGETSLGSHAPANRPLQIRLDPAGLPALPSYRLEIVDSSGATVLEAVPRREAGGLAVGTRRPLPAASYWVRLYEPGPAGALLREFGLRVD